MDLLDSINSPEDIKKLNTEQLIALSSEIRQFLIDIVSNCGGHLASNLGVVELTIALHKVFNTQRDKLIWDVGHQAYVHKILTGRRDSFNTLRSLGGLSGFPKTAESSYDSFNTGHSSTSISAALGFARARDLQGENHSVIAVIGDGALTGGLAFEALNDAGLSKNNMIVILNDNQMSISKNVGGLSKYLNKLRTTLIYTGAKRTIVDLLNQVPLVGKGVSKVIKNTKNLIKYFFIPDTLFSELGFTYVGLVNGHDLQTLIFILKRIKYIKGPILLHVKTIKGKGYHHAEQKPHVFHGISKFNVDTGNSTNIKCKDFSAVFGECMLKLAAKDNRVVAISAAMPLGTGLTDFAKKYKERFFDVGIAEAHAVTMAAGMAAGGLKPVVALYSTFLQRAYDSVLHDVALQDLDVVFAIDRAGSVGEDGETHQGIYDLSYLSHIPNMAILSPSCFSELESMLEYAVLKHKGPIAIRYPRGNEGDIDYTYKTDFEIGKAEAIKEGDSIALIAQGSMVKQAYNAAKSLEALGFSAAVIDVRTIKPLDEELIARYSLKTKCIITIEDNVKIGGLGSLVAATLNKREIYNVRHRILGYPDRPLQHGKISELHILNSLDEKSIMEAAIKELTAN